MGSQLIFALLGIAGRIGGFLITNWLESRENDKERRHEYDLAKLEMESEPFDAGFDNASDHTRWTRRSLALVFAIAAVTVQVFCIYNAGITFPIPVSKDGGFFDWIFGGPSETTLEISLGYIAYKILDIQTMVASFYFTPVGNPKRAAKHLKHTNA
ncbi:hypothetical protein [Rubellicoccus peritrichatus]|uniref:Uncharacterized protein n=1 Tax=Rubellicoccus peritrichatus TaxID=3080537 RepID=A0AAQ3LEL8_9BACT|nr:hypothetical protein [Puniceicoccus sp. CR14]WOO43164.1 hypothetical protein RZN69_08665 [Puniceicoccus sp. CR14]